MRRALLLGLGATAVVVCSPTRVSATPPVDVSLVVATTFDDEPDAITFAGGAAAPDCVDGTVEDTFSKATPSFESFPPKSDHAHLTVGKVFHCSGGDVSVTLNVTLDFNDFTTEGRWVVTGGTGDYARLHGTGSIVGTPFEGGIEDSYFGKVHSD
jgi:hypothetical protein